MLYGKYSGTELEYEGEKYLIMRQSESTQRWPGIIKVETNHGKHYYKTIYLSGGGSVKYYKRYASKKTRMCADVPNGSAHKKTFDLWWTLY